MHAALKTVLERALPSAARMNLRFDDDHLAAFAKNLLRNSARLINRRAGFAGRNIDSALGEQLLGLIFVNIHRVSMIGCARPTELERVDKNALEVV